MEETKQNKLLRQIEKLNWEYDCMVAFMKEHLLLDSFKKFESKYYHDHPQEYAKVLKEERKSIERALAI